MKSFQMKKIVAATFAAAAMLAAASGAQAVTTNSAAFAVDINLTASCTVSAPTNATISYVDGAGTATITNSAFNVTCTTSLPYTVGLLTSPALAAPVFPVTDSVVGIAYTLTVTPPVGGGTGTGAAQAYTVNPSMAFPQAGTCAAPTLGVCTNAGATNNTYVVTVTY